MLDGIELNIMRKTQLEALGSEVSAELQAMYIDAYHPSQWNMVTKPVYVDDIVAVIKDNFPVIQLPPANPQPR